MDIHTKFVSQDNKRILWEIMVENNLFTNIPNKYVNKIKTDFEDSLEKISKTIVPTDNILNLNKKSIMQMMEEVKKYSQIAEIPITSAEVLTKKQEKFQKGLQSKQEEFTSLIQPVKPQSIDFTEKITDEPIGSEMDLKLSQTIAWREKQLSQVLEKQSPVEASEWINNGKKVNNTSVSNHITSVSNHITIGNSTKIDESNIINLKKVSFVDANDTSLDVNELRLHVSELQNNTVEEPKKIEAPPFNFMDKLKKKDGLEEVKSDLVLVKADIEWLKTNMDKLMLDNKLILENQEKILDKIEQIAFQVGSI